MKDYKLTLNMPKTAFEMKANLSTKELEIQDFWRKNKIYQKVLDKNKNNQKWTLHDGPPYANGNIHVGHSLNYILKDIIVRYHNMIGDYSEFIPGWDTHGLPIEHALIKKGINTNPNLSIAEKRDNCLKFAKENIENQKKQFLRLGMLSDFDKIYCTYDIDYEVRQLKIFKEFVEKKIAYQALKPVYWSWSSQTALAEAEIEYANEKSPSIFVSFKVAEDTSSLKKDDELIIWTTTPWTIPANLAIAVNPRFTYMRIRVNDHIFIVSKDSIERIKDQLGWSEYEIISEINGKDLELVKYIHPIYKRLSPIILADYVSNSDGTGLVHNAPDFGTEDYVACKNYKIDPIGPIDNFGKYNEKINDKDLIGIFYDDANKIVTKKLKNENALLKLSFFSHSVAHDWRTKKPVIYRATKQWFVNIGGLKSQLTNVISKINFSNNWVKNHMLEMIENRQDWCISRQRYWGVPIIIIYDENDQPLFDSELFDNIINIIAKEGTNVWFEKPVEYFLTPKYRDSKKSFKKEKDIMDVWFDSGTSFSLLKENELNFPANLYLEGFDQFRGWFNSSLINSFVYTNQAPYKDIIAHGFTLDEKGQKMSKSLGNVIDPIEICNIYGADILRLWAANCNFQEDVKVSKNIISQSAELYRRIRNSLFRFILGNIEDFNFETDANYNFSEADSYVLYETNILLKKINDWYKKYDFINVVKSINSHVLFLSSWYFDLIKDSLYCDGLKNESRRAIQTVLFIIFKSLLVSLTPIIPHTCEEAYKFFKSPNKKESIVLEDWISSLKNINIGNVNINYWNAFFKIREVAYAELEKLRVNKIINKNNEAILTINFDNSKLNFKEKTLAKYLNVAKVIINNKNEKDIFIKAEKSNYKKCLRCWNYYDQSEMENDEICKRCAKFI